MRIKKKMKVDETSNKKAGYDKYIRKKKILDFSFKKVVLCWSMIEARRPHLSFP